MHPLADFQTGKICDHRQLDRCLMSYCKNVEFSLWELLDTLKFHLINWLLKGTVFKPPSSAQRNSLCVSFCS